MNETKPATIAERVARDIVLAKVIAERDALADRAAGLEKELGDAPPPPGRAS